MEGAVSFYDRIAATPDGLRHLATARLTTVISEEMWTALEAAGLDYDAVLSRLTWRQRRALRKISITAGALAAFLFECRHEMTTALVPVGQPRADVIARREAAAREGRQR